MKVPTRDPILVSVVTPSLNSARFIERTIRSVADQEHPWIEHILVDGGSEDGTVDILRRFPHLRWVSEADRGQSDALNKGFRLARGEIVGWLNADDTYLPGAVEAAVAYLGEHSGASAVFGCCNVVDESDGVQYVLDAPPFSLAQDLLEHRVPQPATFMRRGALAEAGFVDERLNYVMDRDLFMKLGARGRLDAVDNIWANFRECAGTKTVSHPERFWRETLQVFDRFFAQADLPSDVLAVKAQAYGRAHWTAGILACTDIGNRAAWAQGIDDCRRALACFPLLTADLRFVAEQLVHWAVTRVGPDDAAEYVASVLECSAPPSAKRANAVRIALAHLYAAMALMVGPSDASRAGQARTRVRWVWSAVRRDPAWLTNGGVLATLARNIPPSLGFPV